MILFEQSIAKLPLWKTDAFHLHYFILSSTYCYMHAKANLSGHLGCQV